MGKAEKRAPETMLFADGRQKAILPPEGGRMALSANERIAEFLDFAIQAKFVYVNKLKRAPETTLFEKNEDYISNTPMMTMPMNTIRMEM